MLIVGRQQWSGRGPPAIMPADFIAVRGYPWTFTGVCLDDYNNSAPKRQTSRRRCDNVFRGTPYFGAVHMKKSRYLIFLLFCISLVGWEQQKRSTYVLGPEDQIEITALDVQ